MFFFVPSRCHVVFFSSLVGSSLYQGIDESAERMQGAKALSVDPKLASKMFCQFEVFDVLHSSIKEVLPPSTFNVVACFREMHRVMESPDVARCFLNNVAYLLKPHGVFVALVHDGSAVWSVLQKEVPDGALPAGFRPQAKKQLFSLSLDEPTRPGHFYGVKYNLNVKKEEAVSNCASVKGGFLINSHQFILAAERCGLRMLSMTNASELLDNYRHIYPESLAKRINGNALHAEQKELVDLHALFVFMRE